jgi:hypothetical protein
MDDAYGNASYGNAGTNYYLHNVTGGWDLGTEDRTQSSAGSIAATFTFANADRYVAAIVAFRTASANTAPNSPTSLAQYKSNGTTSISTGGYTNQTTVVIKSTVTDPDVGDTDQLCVEIEPNGSSFTNTETSCGSLVATGSTASDTMTVSNGTIYKWQVRTKDAGGLYSSWVQFNSGSAAFTVDTVNPATGTVYDGGTGGVEIAFNSGSLSSLSCNWSGFSDAGSGLASYDYSFGTTAGATDILTWTNVGTGTTNVTASSLTLHTSQTYFCNVRANDQAGNVSSVVSSTGQLVAPTLTFTISTNAIAFASLNVGDSYTDSQSFTLTTSTNAYHSYLIDAYETSALTSGAHTIADYSAPASAPTSWPSGVGFGYTITGGAASAVFSSGTKYAHFGTSGSPDAPAVHAGLVTGSPIAAEQETVTLKVAASNTTTAGNYSNQLVWSVVALY